MSRVVKTLVQSLALLAIVMSPVAVFAIQIPNDFESIPDSLEEELVAQDDEDSQQDVDESQQASVQPDTGDSIASETNVTQSGSVTVPVAQNSDSPRVGQSAPRVPTPKISFSSPGKLNHKASVSFMSHSPTVSFGSTSSSCCDIASGGDISNLMVFAQPRPFESVSEVGSLNQFIDPTAGFSQSLYSPGTRSGSIGTSGSSRAQGVSSGGQRPAGNRSATQPAASMNDICGCAGGDCGSSDSSSNLIMAVAGIIKQFATCVIFSN